MKITCVLGPFLPVPPLRGGAIERRWNAITAEFAKLGHDVVVISRQYGDLPHREIRNGVLHVRVQGYDAPASMKVRQWRDFRYSLRAAGVVPKDSDVVITNSFWLPLLLRGQLGRRAYVDVARMPKGQMRLYRRAGRLRANSTAVADAIRRELPLHRAKQVTLVPNPLPFVPSGASEKKRNLLFVGRVAPEKGLHLLIDALRRLPNAPTLDVVGPWDVSAGGGGEDYLAELKKRAEGLDVAFRGPVWDSDALNQYYRGARIFIYPSVAEAGETFGLAPLEAMSWGCVPVVSDLACFKDFIEHNENGLIFDHRDPDAGGKLARELDILLTDPDLVERLERRALQVRESHSTQGIAKQFLSDFFSMAEVRQ